LWLADQFCAQLVDFYIKVTRHIWQYVLVCTSGSDLEWNHRFATFCNVDELTFLYLERWTVDTLAIDQYVLVHDQLTRLCNGAGKAGTQHKSIQARFQGFDQDFTGQTCTTG